MTLQYGQACEGGLRQAMDWDAQQQRWVPLPEEDVEQLLALAGHGSSEHDAPCRRVEEQLLICACCCWIPADDDRFLLYLDSLPDL